MQAKKSLGQNWLKSESVAREIVRAANLSEEEIVLEIGPGTGLLTAPLLATGARVIAVEKDDRAIPLLQEKFSEQIASGKLELIHGDILKMEMVCDKVVANIPYYITGQILRKFLGAVNQPKLLALMVQNEVAKRIMAKDGKESLLSISVKVYGTPKYIKKVPAKYFSPAPKVDSAILLIGDITKNHFKNISEEKFFEIVKRGFGSKRKMLRNHLNVSPETFAKCKIDEKSRAENLSLENWLCLAKE